MSEQENFLGSFAFHPLEKNEPKNCDDTKVPYKANPLFNNSLGEPLDNMSSPMSILQQSSSVLSSTSPYASAHNSSDFNNMMSLPREMTFNDDNLMSVIAYSCLFVVAASGNLIVFITLFRSRRIKSRVNTFIMHLAIADLIVAFIMLPLETGWHVTVAWQAGDAACRILMFFRALGFYLSSFVLVTISLDRYFSIVHPMSLHDAERRGKIMLVLAWALSVVASLPQINDITTSSAMNYGNHGQRHYAPPVLQNLTMDTLVSIMERPLGIHHIRNDSLPLAVLKVLLRDDARSNLAANCNRVMPFPVRGMLVALEDLILLPIIVLKLYFHKFYPCLRSG